MTNTKQSHIRHFLVVLAAVAFLLSAFVVAMPTKVSADDFEYKKLGVYEDEEAWVFGYKNEKCFCIESDIKDGPKGYLGEEIYNNPNMTKALYYGQYGEEPWEGFAGDEAKGVVVTSRVLSDFYKNTNNDGLKGVKEFKEFLKSKPVPPTEATKFTKNELKVTWDAEKKLQVTEDNEIKGTEGQQLTFTLPENVAVIKKDGTKLTGKVTLAVGDIFHLEAAPGVTGEYSTGEIGKSFKFQTIVIKTKGDSQNVSHLKKVEDRSFSTEFKTKWLDFSDVKISKKDITNKKELPGAKMKVIDAESGAVVDEWTSGKAPHFIKNLVKGRKYTLTETLAPKGFKLSTEKISFIAGEKSHITMFNKPMKPKKPNKPNKPKPKKHEHKSSPNTGDSSQLLVPSIIFGLAILALAVIYIRKRMEK